MPARRAIPRPQRCAFLGPTALPLALACGPAPAGPATDPTTTSASATSEDTAPTTTSGPPTTTLLTTTGSDTTGLPPPIRGEWTGHYSSGAFGPDFFPCGTDENWRVNGLPDFLICQQLPLRLRVQGELSFSGPDGPELFVETILEGPCSVESCDETPPLGACNSFDALCLNEPQECDLFVETCPDGQKCTNTGGQLGCVPVADPGLPVGSPCTTADGGLDDCDADSVCADGLPDTNTGTCTAYCLGPQDAPECTDPGATCLEYAPDLFGLCIPGCDPLAQDCPMGQLCTADQGLLRCLPDQSGGAGLPAAPCDVPVDCNPGLFCANSAFVPDCEPIKAGCCSEFCDLNAPTCSLPGQTCVPWFTADDPAPPGLEDLGACVLPR